MRRTTLGDSGPPATELGLGLAAVGRPAYFVPGREVGDDRSPEAMRSLTGRLLDFAYDSGIRYFDVARSYGRAEEFLAGWLNDRKPGDVTIGSKWGYRYVGDWKLQAPVHEVKDHSIDAFDLQLVASRQWLGDRLDLYQIHSATLESGVLEDRGVLGRLSELAAEGVAVGLSVSGSDQAAVIRRALAVEVDGTNPLTCVQATWNLLEQSAAPALEEAHAAGWGVIVKEVLANGRLAAHPPIRLVERAERLAVSPATVAVAEALAMPWASTVLVGATSSEHISSACAALGVEPGGGPWPAEDSRNYWGARSRLPWG